MKKWKYLLKVVMAVGVIAMTAVQICTAAEGTAQAAVSEVTPVSISTNEISGWPAGPEITSETGVLMDADSGTLLYSKGGDEIRYPASITKIMTLLLAVENCSLKEDVVFTETGTRDISWDSGNIGMQVGEVMSMRACLYALVIRSANEVAAQIAEHVGGTEQHFVDMMNERAAQIGCTNTHFVNASGLPDPDHYSTAHDMALIMREGLKNKKFRRIIGATDYTIKPTNMNSEPRVLHTHHPMLAPESSYHYDGCIGGKTGYTSEAGNTLVTAAEKNGATYITVTMKAADLAVASTDSTALFNYGYQNFTKAQVNGGEVSVPNGVTVDNLTVQENSQNGNTVDDYYYNDYLLGSVEVPEATPTPEPAADALSDTSGGNTDQADQNEKSDTVGEEKTSAGMPELRKILLIIGAAMLLLIIILSIALAKKGKKILWLSLHTMWIYANRYNRNTEKAKEKEENKMGKIKVTECGGIKGLKVVEPTVFGDARGYFMETYNYNDFKEAGIDVEFVQDNQSSSHKGVLRGLHFQINYPQDKLVRVVNGEVFDVAVDLREGSETYGKWFGVVLSAENKKQFFIPKGFAHGFLVLSEHAEFVYKCSDFYHPNDEGGLIWNDPDIGVEWPIPEGMELSFSDKDTKWGSFKEYRK